MNDPVTQPSPESPRRAGHETTDASPFYLGLFALGLLLMIALVLPFLSWTLGRFEAAAARHDPAQSPLAGDQAPPEPRLQPRPADDLARWREEEILRLSSGLSWLISGKGNSPRSHRTSRDLSPRESKP